MTKDQDCHCEERSDAAIRIPVPRRERLPCGKGDVCERRQWRAPSRPAGEGKGGECPMPVRDLPSHPHPRLPQTKTPGMTAGTKASLFRPPSQRPPQARSEAPVLLSSPVPFGIVSKGRAAALPLVVSRRVWEGNSKSLPESFLGSARGYSFDSKRISSCKPPTFVGGSPSTQGVALPRHAGSSCPTGCSCQGTPSAS